MTVPESPQTNTSISPWPLLDIEQPDQLEQYLRQQGHISGSFRITSRILAGGVSNRTVLVNNANGDALVLKQALSRLRVADEWNASPLRIHREAAGIRMLNRLMPPGSVPQLVFEDLDHHILAITAVSDPHDNWRDLLLTGVLNLGHVTEFGQLLGHLHRCPVGLAPTLAEEFADDTFFESLRVDPYYHASAHRNPTTALFFHKLIADMHAARSALVHGDYSPKNVLVQNGRLVLLDFEVIHWGDPAFDVGFALTHFLSKANHLLDHRDQFIAAGHRFINTYQSESETDNLMSEERAVRHTIACLLARIDGRSPLGYLSLASRERQRRTALSLITNTPPTLDTLVQRFAEHIDESPHAHH